ncbi:hypothetical protein [Dielma fastidiosa]|uniref:DUF3995 domain-containing protein n=1 Tax=Dielma fastidiosa TaxID=1034346 RepID=A0AB35UI96_9FIRM|nr:hypothetical protein [Dielma fastidiosa]MDY5167613.1 hypothetical protein [Dielma fastidiosa]
MMKKKLYAGLAGLFCVFYSSLFNWHIWQKFIHDFFYNTFHIERFLGLRMDSIILILCAVLMCVFGVLGYDNKYIKKKYGIPVIIAFGFLLCILAYAR